MTTEFNPKRLIASGFDELARDGRLELKMVKDGRPYTDADMAALRSELDEWRLNHIDPATGRAYRWDKTAQFLGLSGSTLSEWRAGKYRGDNQAVSKAVDEHLAKERARADRFDIREFAHTEPVVKSYGVITAAIKYNSMAAIVGDSGVGKTTLALGFAKGRDDVTYLRVDEGHGDARGVSMMLWQGFRLGIPRSHRERMREITAFLQKNRNIVLLMDEAQKLKADGLEVIRDIYDGSDPEGRRNVPIVFFGDQDFYKLLVRARNGEPSPIKPQMTRRIYPILNLEVEGRGVDGSLFTADDVVKILRNQRLRIVTNEGVHWLASLANVRGYGSLGFAMVVARMAFDVSVQSPITSEDLLKALQMAVGPRLVKTMDECSGGRLLASAG